MRKLFFLSTLFIGLSVCPCTFVNAQGVGINSNNSLPDPSAALDVNLTGKGTLLSRMTTSQRDAISNPAEGLQIFNTTTKCFEAYVLNAWNIIACPGCVAPPSPDTITGPVTTCPGSSGVIYSISSVSGASSYTWTVPPGAAITSGQTTTSIAVTFGTSSGFISVKSNSSCGSSDAYALGVTLNPDAPSTPGAITGATSTCANSSGNIYSISPVTNATTYTWTVPAGSSITNGQGTTSITVTFGSTSGNVAVTAGNSCGTSAASSLAITLAPGSTGTQTFTSGLQSFTVPACVSSITINAYGAEGGVAPNCSSTPGGKGAYVFGTFAVTPGHILNIMVGGQGGATYGAGGGGGGSFVWNTSNANLLLIAAAGEGGAGCGSSYAGAGGSATITPAAGNNTASGGSNGAGGNGGAGGTCAGGGGGPVG